MQSPSPKQKKSQSQTLISPPTKTSLPKPKLPSPRSPQELISHLLSEIEHLSKFVDLETARQRLLVEINDRQKQLERVIAEIKSQQTTLKQMDTNVRREIERQHQDRRRELQSQYDSGVTALGALKADMDVTSQRLSVIQGQVAEQHTMNSTLIRSNKEQSQVYEDLAAKVENAKDLYGNYTELIEGQKKLNKDIEQETGELKKKQEKTKSDLDEDLKSYAGEIEEKKRHLDGEVRMLEQKMTDISTNIADAIAHDAERVKNLQEEAQSIGVQRAILKRERDELLFEKHKFQKSVSRSL